MSLLHLIESRRADGWLHLDAPATHALTPEEMLAWNAGLPAPAKLVLTADGSPRLRMEVPLDPDGDREAVARAIFASALTLRRLGDAAELPAGEALPLEAIMQLCTEAGWAAVPRTAHVSVDLDCPEFFTAQLTPHGGGLAIRIEVAQAAEACAEGVRALMLRAGAVVRFVRPVVAAGAARFEILFTTHPTALEIGEALAALSSACRLAGREAAALAGDEPVAREYLAMLARENTARVSHHNNGGLQT